MDNGVHPNRPTSSDILTAAGYDIILHTILLHNTQSINTCSKILIILITQIIYTMRGVAAVKDCSRPVLTSTHYSHVCVL